MAKSTEKDKGATLTWNKITVSLRELSSNMDYLCLLQIRKSCSCGW